jgi:hypothetical protein
LLSNSSVTAVAVILVALSLAVRITPNAVTNAVVTAAVAIAPVGAHSQLTCAAFGLVY